VRNIPTDLLRTLVTVVDLASYSRAGERLGRSQPTVSLQVKRLQDLLEVPLFDKDGSGVRLTEAGQTATAYARRILALNDEMVLRLAGRDARGKLRIGIPNDYADHFMPRLMERFTDEQAALNLNVVCDVSHKLLDSLQEGLYDVVVAMTSDGPAEGAFMTWKEPLTWIGSRRTTAPEPRLPLRIVCYPEGCVYRDRMLAALQRDGLDFEIVYTSSSLAGIEAAVASGFGLTALSRRIVPPQLRAVSPEAVLPALGGVVVGIYLGEHGSRMEAQAVAARFADLFCDAEQVAA
jgi:DNA-binding transcriptional LysR family regulator